MSLSVANPPATAVRLVTLTNQTVVSAVSVLFFLPSMIFATGLRPLPALAVIAGGCGALCLVFARPSSCGHGALSEALVATKLLSCCGVALILLLLGGETHVFFTTWDWLTRDAVLSDLVNRGFPVGYAIDGTDYLLRAPLGMYLTPAVIGRAFGLVAAHVALLAQNALILGATFYLLTILGRGWKHLAILVLFAGISVVGLFIGRHGAADPTGPFWLLWGLDAWHPLFQYSGALVQFFWVPNHALPGWWLAVLLLLHTRSQIDVATLGVSVAGALLWSPLSIVAVAPWLLYCAMRSPRIVLLARRTWLGVAASGGFVPILVYLILASSSIANGSSLDEPNFVFLYLLFISWQLPTLLFLFFIRNHVAREDRSLLVASGLFLLVLPFFRFGPNNDLVMRGSIVSLAIVAFVFGSTLLSLNKRSTAAVVGWILVVAAAPSAAIEIGRALATPRYAISDCSLMEASRALGDKGVPTNYVTPLETVPDWLLDARSVPIQSSERQTCWPDKAVAPSYFGYTYKTVSKP